VKLRQDKCFCSTKKCHDVYTKANVFYVPGICIGDNVCNVAINIFLLWMIYRRGNGVFFSNFGEMMWHSDVAILVGIVMYTWLTFIRCRRQVICCHVESLQPSVLEFNNLCSMDACA
jgi:hypothetical protein